MHAGASPGEGWPERFRARHGRAPRILHIGNVANYAYANARLMRRHGVEADVFDPDGYHIMATPEWYEASIRGDWGDDWNPCWSKVDRGGFERPEWFVQGPRDMALAVLRARRGGDQEGARNLEVAMRRASERRAGLLQAASGLPGLLPSNSPVMRRLKRFAAALLYRTKRTIQTASKAGVAEGAPAEARKLAPVAAALTEALAAYDIVQGYALGAVHPLAVGHPNVVAYDLGTMRGLPFEESEMGRLARWIYTSAHEVFVTNSDCLQKGRELEIAPERLRPVLHAFDTDAALRSEAAMTEPAGPDGTASFFAPARHYWRSDGASFRKGNDIIIEAAARLAAAGREFRIVFVEWGEDVAASKALIAERSLAARVTWIRPRSRPDVWPLYHRALAVIDQFSAASLGGVGLETLALGKPLITRYDEAAGRPWFSEPPPLINAATADEVEAAMRSCLDHPGEARARGAAGKAWMAREHGVARQMDQQFRVYEGMLERADAARGDTRCGS